MSSNDDKTPQQPSEGSEVKQEQEQPSSEAGQAQDSQQNVGGSKQSNEKGDIKKEEDDSTHSRSQSPAEPETKPPPQPPRPARVESEKPSRSRRRRRNNQPSWMEDDKENAYEKQVAPRPPRRAPSQYQQPQMQMQQQPMQQVQQQPQKESGGKNPLRLRLDLNLEVEVTLKARIHGDLTLALLYVIPFLLSLANIRCFPTTLARMLLVRGYSDYITAHPPYIHPTPRNLSCWVSTELTSAKATLREMSQ